MAFVERKPEAALMAEKLEEHARCIAAYTRPLHYVILETGQMPLNRVNKTDFVRLHEMAQKEVVELRAQGGWNR